jgi:hypothetical protein
MQAGNGGIALFFVALLFLLFAGRAISTARRTGIQMPLDPKVMDWLMRDYFISLTYKVNASLDYLHSAITWSITTTTAGMGLALAQQDFPNEKSWVLSLALIVFVTHFCVRAAKGYINVIRYAALQRRIQMCLLLENDGTGGPDCSAVVDQIKALDLEWQCPLKRRTVFYKLLLEFGFSYFYLLLIGIATYVATHICFTGAIVWLGALALVLVFVEFYFGLVRSPYMRAVCRDDLAEKYR